MTSSTEEHTVRAPLVLRVAAAVMIPALPMLV
jgi:hypothetical protein